MRAHRRPDRARLRQLRWDRLGTGVLRQGLSKERAFELMNAAWGSAITWFDTADLQWRTQRAGHRPVDPVPRGPARLTTKTFNPMWADGGY
jgi:aryl-alcohol dehydrogenase-like predicted oxidoreductase